MILRMRFFSEAEEDVLFDAVDHRVPYVQITKTLGPVLKRRHWVIMHKIYKLLGELGMESYCEPMKTRSAENRADRSEELSCSSKP